MLLVLVHTLSKSEVLHAAELDLSCCCTPSELQTDRQILVVQHSYSLAVCSCVSGISLHTTPTPWQSVGS
jgi:hypothetical protein